MYFTGTKSKPEFEKKLRGTVAFKELTNIVPSFCIAPSKHHAEQILKFKGHHGSKVLL